MKKYFVRLQIHLNIFGSYLVFEVIVEEILHALWILARH